MRKVLFSIFAGTLILVGCSKDGGSGSASIVGTWNVNKVTSQFYLNNVPSGSDTTTTGSIEFNSNGNFISVDDMDTASGTYDYNASSKLLTVIISGSDTSHLTVTNLTSNNLHFVEDETQVSGATTVRVTSDADYKR
jgi:lipocalin-like protein